MNDKVEVGEYVRTEKGYIGILVNMFTHENGKVEYPEPQEWDIRLSNGKIYVIYEADMQDNIKNHSELLIDLVEEFDFINGYPVRKINNELCNFDLNIMKWIPIVNIDDVGEILTHESYERECFRVEKEYE